MCTTTALQFVLDELVVDCSSASHPADVGVTELDFRRSVGNEGTLFVLTELAVLQHESLADVGPAAPDSQKSEDTAGTLNVYRAVYSSLYLL